MQCQCHNSWSLHCFTFITLTFTFFDQCAASDLGHLFSVMMTSLRFETFETETLWLCLDVSVPGSSSLCEGKDGSTEAACNTVLEEDRKGGDVQALHTHTRCSRWSRVQSVLFCDVLRALGDRVAYTSSWIEITMSQCHCCNMLQTKMMVAIEGSFLLRPVQPSRKKMYEQQRNQILGTQFNVDSLAGAQEQARLQHVTATLVETYDLALSESYHINFWRNAV